MKRILMTSFGCLALIGSATGPTLSSTMDGDYLAFKLGDSIYTCAYRIGENPTLLLLTGDLDNNFDVVGEARVHGPDIKFVQAEIDRNGKVTPLKNADNYVVWNGGDLMFDLGDTLAKLAVLGIAEVEKVTKMEDGRSTKFLRDRMGGADLSVITIDGKSYGVIPQQRDGVDYLHGTKMVLDDGHYLATELVGRPYLKSEVKALVVDLTAANTTAAPASTIAATKSTDAGHDKAKQAVAA